MAMLVSGELVGARSEHDSELYDGSTADADADALSAASK